MAARLRGGQNLVAVEERRHLSVETEAADRQNDRVQTEDAYQAGERQDDRAQNVVADRLGRHGPAVGVSGV